jgi:hypothetical protein
MPNTTEVELTYCCVKCGARATALYDRGDRQYGDLPPCIHKCAVPFEVMDAIASWLDSRVLGGAGQAVTPHPSAVDRGDDR